MFRLTPIVRALLVINVSVFLLQVVIGDVMTALLSLWDIKSSPFRPYQFFTYMFLHGGWGHIFFNMLALASFAPILESYWGDKKFLFFYMATGIGAGIIYTMVNYFMPGQGGGLMLGASGALYGILMAFGMEFPEVELMLLIPPIPVKAKYMVFIMGALTFMMDRSGHIAHIAHFGGALVAFFIILFWRIQKK